MKQPESLRLEGDRIVLRGSMRVGSLAPELNHPVRDEVRRLLERDRAVADAFELGRDAERDERDR